MSRESFGDHPLKLERYSRKFREPGLWYIYIYIYICIYNQLLLLLLHMICIIYIYMYVCICMYVYIYIYIYICITVFARIRLRKSPQYSVIRFGHFTKNKWLSPQFSAKLCKICAEKRKTPGLQNSLRYREYQHGPCARTTRINREA